MSETPQKITEAEVQERNQMSHGPFDHIKHHKKRLFLIALSETANRKKSAEIAGITRATEWLWRQQDPEFAAADVQAREMGADALEDIAHERATALKGGSDVLLIFLLKGLRPEKYRDQWKGELTGPNSGPLQHQVDLKNLTNEQLEQLRSIAAASAIGPQAD